MSESVTVILGDILNIRHKAEARANALSDELLTVLLNAHAQLVALLAGVEPRTLGGKSWDDAGNTRRKAFLEMQKAEVERLVGELLARTYLLTASNFAGETAIERLDERTGSSLLKGWEYVATLDGRTCPVCGADDGKFFAKNQPRPRLARHGNCRCTYVPVARSWRDFGIDIPELAPVKRPAVKHDARLVHHRDGSTSTKFTPRSGEQTSENYNQWLTRQLHEDPAFVRGILGKTRFDLFQRGKITLEGMRVDGRVKRLVEL